MDLTWSQKHSFASFFIDFDAKRFKLNRMRITVDIDNTTLQDLAQITGESKKSPAVAKAVTEFVNRNKAKEFGRLLREGAFDYPATNDEIEAADR
jgi:Arc/MetJ family transcription regulator